MQQGMTSPFVANSTVANSGLLSSLYAQTWGNIPDPRGSEVEVSEDVLPLLGSERDKVETEFNRLLNEWKSERRATSSSIAIAMHPAYQQIVGLGKAGIPLILRELQRELDHWFWALKAISREDPVPSASRGKMREMADIWLRWGREKGYVR